MANVRWPDGSIGSIGQGILRSDKYFTDGELTNPVKNKWNKTPAKAFTPPAKRKWAQGQAGL